MKSITPNGGIRISNPVNDCLLLHHLLSKGITNGNVTYMSHIFIDTYQLPNYENTCIESKKSLLIDNAGGKSEISEMFSIDYFVSIYGAHNVIFEKEVDYWATYKMVDYICTIDNQRVGVSVARAMGYPTPCRFTPEIAASLLHKKLYGLIVARNCVNKSQAFYKSILHIWCQTSHIADLLAAAFRNLNAADYGLDVKGVVLLQLTICNDVQIYRNKLISL